MRLGEFLDKGGLVTAAEVEPVLRHQQAKGGRLGRDLIALGLLTEEQLDAVIHGVPAARGVAGTGVSVHILLSLWVVARRRVHRGFIGTPLRS